MALTLFVSSSRYTSWESGHSSFTALWRWYRYSEFLPDAASQHGIDGKAMAREYAKWLQRTMIAVTCHLPLILTACTPLDHSSQFVQRLGT